MSVTVNPTSSSSGMQNSTQPTGSTGLTSQDFMQLMITQLQHQDPMSPTDSNQLLQQIAQISTLQSSQQMQSTLTGMTLQQSIGAGSNMIGKAVQGLDMNGDQAAGQVVGVQVQDQKVYLALDSGAVLPMENVITIAPAAPPSTTASGASASQSDIAKTIINALSGLTS